MSTGTIETFTVHGTDDLVPCFDQTCSNVFAIACHLVGGDRDRGEGLMIDIYLELRRTVLDGSTVDVTDDWVMRVATAASGLVPQAVDETTARSMEHWLDDVTRRRARSALIRGVRPQGRHTAAPIPRPMQDADGADDVDPADRAVERPPTAAAVTPARRRFAVGAGISAVLVAAVVVASLTLNDDRSDPPAASSVPTTVNAPGGVDESAVLTPTIRAPRVRVSATGPGFILDDVPPGFVAAGASEHRAARIAGEFRLWTEEGATRSTGKWLALSALFNTPSVTTVIAGASREVIGSGPALLSTSDDGVTTIVAHPVGGGEFTLTGGGFSKDELRQLASSVSIRDNDPSFDPSVADLVQSLQLVVAEPTEYGTTQPLINPEGRRWVSYVSRDDLDGTEKFITVTTWQSTASDLLLAEFLAEPSDDVLAPAPPQRTFQTGDLEFSVSGPLIASRAAPDETTIQWHDGNQTITVASNAGLYVMLGAIPSIRQATEQEWNTLFQTVASERPIIDHQVLGPNPVQIGRIFTSDRSRWTIVMSSAPAAVRFEVRNDGAAGVQGTAALDSVADTQVNEYVSLAATLVVVTTDNAGTATGARFTVGGSNPVTVPLVPVRNSGLSAAAYAFSEFVPYRVELVDSAGNSIQSLNE